jgi:hypothetical protein
MNRQLPVNNTCLGTSLADGSLVLLSNVNPSNQQFITVRIAAEASIKTIYPPGRDHSINFTSSANLVSTNDLNRITFFYLLHRLTSLKHFWGQRNDPGEPFFAEFTSDWPKYAGSAWPPGIIIQDNCGIFIKSNIRTVSPADFFGGPLF